MRIIDKKSVEHLDEKSADNLILIDKPADWSSFDVVKKVRFLTRIKKVGHSGTLDPFATGLLILGTGKETKTLTRIIGSTKEYLATLQLGESTDTYDITGTRLTQTDISGIESYNFKSVLDTFIGENDQVPPMYSAKKVGGKRLYKIARQGIEIKRDPHKIQIYEIKELKREGSLLEIYIKCSKGTYIRSLANDIGKRSGYGAFLMNLRRISIDKFVVENALSVQEFSDYWHSLN